MNTKTDEWMNGLWTHWPVGVAKSLYMRRLRAFIYSGLWTTQKPKNMHALYKIEYICIYQPLQLAALAAGWLVNSMDLASCLHSLYCNCTRVNFDKNLNGREKRDIYIAIKSLFTFRRLFKELYCKLQRNGNYQAILLCCIDRMIKASLMWWEEH